MGKIYEFPCEAQQFETCIDRAYRKRRGSIPEKSMAFDGEPYHDFKTGALYTPFSNVIGFPLKHPVKPVLAIDDDDAREFAQAITIRSSGTFEDIDRAAAEELTGVRTADDDDWI